MMRCKIAITCAIMLPFVAQAQQGSNPPSTGGLTQAQADARYTKQTTVYAVDGGIILPQTTTANLLSKTCAASNVGEMWFVTDSVAFQDVANKGNSPIYQDTTTPTSPGTVAVCKSDGGAGYIYVTLDNHAGQVAPR